MGTIVALYRQDATHSSKLVPRLYAEAKGTTLHGEREIREYLSRGNQWFVELRLEVLSVVESGDHSAIEYRRHSNIDGPSPAHVLELIHWVEERIQSAVVFHFS